MRVFKKVVLTVVGVGLLLGVIVGLKATQIASLLGFVGEMQAAGMPPVPVATKLAEQARWEDSMRFTGTLRPVQGVTLQAEVGGTITAIPVENGAKVAAGQLLIEFDTKQETAELASEIASQRLAQLNLDRTAGLLQKRIISQSEYDASKAEFDNASARVAALQAIIEKKTIRAPFAGQVGIRLVNVGQTVSPGDNLIPLQANDPIFVEFAVPQTRLGRVEIGQTVRVSDANDEPVSGPITAINPVVDEASRTARVQGTLSNPGGTLRPGQFVEVDVLMPELREVVAIPLSAVVAAAYGDSVFVVEEQDGKLAVRQQFVQLGGQRGDFVSVTKGLSPGDRVVTAGAFKLTNGAAVSIDDSMQPEPDLAPEPANS